MTLIGFDIVYVRFIYYFKLLSSLATTYRKREISLTAKVLQLNEQINVIISINSTLLSSIREA